MTPTRYIFSSYALHNVHIFLSYELHIVNTTSDQIEYLSKATKGGLNWAQTARNMHDTHIERTRMGLLRKERNKEPEERTGVLGQVCACISRQSDDMEESWADQIDSYADIPEAMALQGSGWQTEFALRPFNC